MTNPYARQQNFTNWQSNNPGAIYNGTDLDSEFNTIAAALNATIANLALIQRADGQIANQSVGRDQLASSVVMGLNPPAAWLTATVYGARDTVIDGTAWYWCAVPHTSGTFSNDLATGYWTLVIDTATLVTTQSAVSATNAATSATNAAASAASAASFASGINDTSSTSFAIGTGSKTFIISSGKQFAAGQFVIVSSRANSSNYMHGQVTSYSTTNLVVNVIDTGGSGTHTDWNVAMSGTQGTAATSGVTGPGSSVVGNLPTFSDTTGAVIQDSGIALSALAPLASPALTGTPTVPTAATGTNTTQAASTAFVHGGFAPLASPALTGNPTAPTQSPGTNNTRVATTQYTDAAVAASVGTAYGAVGTDVLNGTFATPGTTGSLSGLSGTWRNMGNVVTAANCCSIDYTCLWRRIS